MVESGYNNAEIESLTQVHNIYAYIVRTLVWSLKNLFSIFLLDTPDYFYYTNKRAVNFYRIKNFLRGFQGHENYKSYKNKFLRWIPL